MAGIIAVTGASGFVGRHVLQRAEEAGCAIRGLTRQELGEIGRGPIDPVMLRGCGAVIHAAARAHRMGEHGASALAAYRQTNVTGTQALIEAMSQAGVRRLVYVSSIKALGERSRADSPLRPSDNRHPEDPYGISKAEAEATVLAAHDAGRIDAVIIRPVLVHGPGAKGNLERLMNAVLRGQPLPVGCTRNRRSLIGVANLADALLVAATWDCRTKAGDDLIYHLSDDGVVSTRRLVEVLGEGMGVQSQLLPLPRWLMVAGSSLLGKSSTARRLFDDLEVDDSDFRRDFGWQPHVSLEDGLRQMAAAYAREHEGRH
jgi:nucleoside-diphosphate-sugar epimerase